METFTLFNSFPPEIHSMILESCEQNDSVCLRLTCQYFYTLPLARPRAPLTHSSVTTLCTNPSISHENTWLERYQHRLQCHRISHEAYVQLRRQNGQPEPELRSCQTQRWGLHCECFTRKGRLHHRLKDWMPTGLRFCGICEMFTRRKKSHNGRCYHGRGKPAVRQETLWTHRSRRGAFGRKVWKKWFNNHAMNRFELRLREERVRRGLGRYALRTIAPKQVDTRIARDCTSYD